MERADCQLWQDQRSWRPLLVALAYSLLVHVCLFWTVELGSQYGFWQFTPIGALAKALGLDRLAPRRVRTQTLQPESAETRPSTKLQEREEMLLFVDVDPSQATSEAPPNTPYYSPFNSLAANPDTSRDLSVPEIDGTQDKVLKTKNTLRPTPTPRVSQPDQPDQSDVQSGPDQKPTPPVVAKAIEPVPPPEAAQKAGDTLMARATPVLPRIDASAFAPEQPTTNSTGRTRHRRVADALASRQLNPYSALIGEKYKQEGGVKRFSVSSTMSVRGTPLGSYDARIVAAVQQSWYILLEDHRYSSDCRGGKVVLNFRLTADGRVTDMRVAESDVGEIFTTACELAVTKPAPYDKWPTDVRKAVGADYREVCFTFYY